MDSIRTLTLKSFVTRLLVVSLIGVLTAPIVSADQLVTTMHPTTSSLDFETTPTLGNDGSTDIVVYTVRERMADTSFGPGDIWYQRLVDGAPSGEPEQVTSGPTDDQLNDISGDYIVYTAYDSVTAYSGAIIIYEISTGMLSTLGTASIIQEPKIDYDKVVWREGGAFAAMVMYYQLGSGIVPIAIGGPVPPTFDVQIGSRFAVWAELDSDYDVYAYDFSAGAVVPITNTPAVHERQPATSGDWIVWQQQDGATITIEALNMATSARVSIDNGAGNYNPSIDGDLVAWESDVAGNLDIWIHRLSVGDSFQVTTDSDDQYLNDVFDDMVAYVDMSGGTEDVYVSTLEFVADEPLPVELDFEFTADGAAVSAGAVISEQWAEWSTHIYCHNNVVEHTDACTILDSNNPPASQLDLRTVDQDKVLVVAANIDDLDGDGLVDTPVAEPGGGQIRITFDSPMDIESVVVVDVDSDEPDSAVLAVVESGGGTFVTWIPGTPSGVSQEVYIGRENVIDLRIQFDGPGALASVNGPTPIQEYPIADAGVDQTVHVGAVVTLNGTGSSDPDGDYPLAYEWTLWFESTEITSQLSDPLALNPSFAAASSGGDYSAGLIVIDAQGHRSLTDLAVVSTTNTAPVADAGDDQVVELVGTRVALDGSHSYDDDGDLIDTYTWTLVRRPEGSSAVLSDSNTAYPEFSADVNGEYEAMLIVSDGFTNSDSDSVLVSFSNVPPVADSGGNQAVTVGDAVVLDGRNSYDANNDPLTYYWSFVSLPTNSGAVLGDATSDIAWFDADVDGIFVVGLVVNDGIENSISDNVSIVATFTQSQAIDMAVDIVDAVNNLPKDVFKNKNMGKSLTNKLSAAISKIQEGDYADARNKMVNDVLKRTDGCATGGAPDKNDWIPNCDAQADIYPLVIQLISLLDEMVGG